MGIRTTTAVAFASGLAAAALMAAPAPTLAQSGLGAWDFEHAQPGPGGSGIAGNRLLGDNATGGGVAKPLGFKESTPQVTGLPEPAIDPEIEYAKGYTDLGYGAYQRAAADFNRVLRVQPRKYKALFMLGVAYNSAGDTRKAADAWALAVKVGPQEIDARREYAVALARLGETEAARAQYAVIKARADACRATCAEASVLSSLLARIQSALSVFVKS
jgi:tetratricopeptide (TPR) repeat protein